MPIYLYWGEDDFAMAKAIESIRHSVVDANWASFNYDKIAGDRSESIIQALDLAMTPPFGLGSRLVWLVDTTVTQQCSEELLAQLESALPAIPESSVLLLTSRSKPDGRLKSTKLLQKSALVEEFALIPPWKTEELVQRVRQASGKMKLRLTNDAVELLAESVGNDTRRLFSELEKLQLYAGSSSPALNASAVANLVACNTQNSLQLATAIREGKQAKALGLVTDLHILGEPALRIVATLIGQFRTWLLVKVAIESGERDEKAIATSAEVGNPKRIYFLRQEVKSISSQQLIAALPVLLELEVNLKQGADSLSTMQTKAIELCQIFH
ncbi:MAG: DNA polymerase III subunit delta [Cyanosarcina radialis HA8281-LM2]|jgi:DNA polymerase-3 subunit delta|nr:DNA polymerase III subunit delta [Cyanosarcina radialis HA8281-LM2]